MKGSYLVLSLPNEIEKELKLIGANYEINNDKDLIQNLRTFI